MNRNLNIDFFRGLAVLNVIVIHTAFWYGEWYTPTWFQALTLAVDAPLFFFLSGYTSIYKKKNTLHTFKSLLIMWLKWCAFLLLLSLFSRISPLLGHEFAFSKTWQELKANFLFVGDWGFFTVVGDMTWFIKTYFMVVLVCTILMQIMEFDEKREGIYKLIFCLFLLILFVWKEFAIFDFPTYLQWVDQTFIFYSLMYMIGANRTKFKLNGFLPYIFMMLISAGGLMLSMRIQNLSFVEMQTAKFPPTLMWLFFSLFSIFTFLFLENKFEIKGKVLVHIGQIAIFYYFANGIGTNMNIYPVWYIHEDIWFVKWLVCLLCNLIIVIPVAELCALLYRPIKRLILMLEKWLKLARKEKRNECV